MRPLSKVRRAACSRLMRLGRPASGSSAPAARRAFSTSKSRPGDSRRTTAPSLTACSRVARPASRSAYETSSAGASPQRTSASWKEATRGQPGLPTTTNSGRSLRVGAVAVGLWLIRVFQFLSIAGIDLDAEGHEPLDEAGRDVVVVDVEPFQAGQGGDGQERLGTPVAQDTQREVQDAEALHHRRPGQGGGDVVGDLAVAQPEVSKRRKVFGPEDTVEVAGRRVRAVLVRA